MYHYVPVLALADLGMGMASAPVALRSLVLRVRVFFSLVFLSSLPSAVRGTFFLVTGMDVHNRALITTPGVYQGYCVLAA